MYTETALAQGYIVDELSCGGMVLDRNSGEVVPADQIILDPLHIDKLDMLSDGVGSLKLGVIEIEEEDEVETELDEDTEVQPKPHFDSADEELEYLVREQHADDGRASTTSTKRQREQFAKKRATRKQRVSKRGSRKYKYKTLRPQQLAA